MIERRLRFLLVFENAQMAVQALPFECVKFRGQVSERVAAHIVASQKSQVASQKYMTDGMRLAKVTRD